MGWLNIKCVNAQTQLITGCFAQCVEQLILMLSCVDCGACCATFRVSFYWAEADPFTGGTVPAELTTKISPNLVSMEGTNQPNPRCVALTGEIGQQVSCSIYEKRSSTCREFEAGSVDCLKARLKHGISDDIIPIQVA